MLFRRSLNAERSHDLAAFNRLVLAHQDAVYNCAYRLLGDETAAAEATQAAFASALRERPPAEGREAGGPALVWLLRCLVRACQDQLHAARAPARRVMNVLPLQQGLAALEPELRVVVALVDVAGLDYGQAAAVLQVSPSQVRHSLARGRQRLING